MENKLPKDFNAETYLKLNPDVKAVGADAVQHYLQFGIDEKRQYKEFANLSQELAKYDSNEPQDINAFNLFYDEWSTHFEDENGNRLTKGNFKGVNDERLEWLFSKINVENKKILELGPLEAAHSLLLEKQGAEVLSIEANLGAFLRCLTIKNQYSLKTKFLLGDFNKLNLAEQKFDLVLASGVLYHMSDPVSFLKKFSQYSNNLFL